jgi:hypothetical protein
MLPLFIRKIQEISFQMFFLDVYLAIAEGRIQYPFVNSRMLWATRSWQISHRVFVNSANGLLISCFAKGFQ